MSAGRGKHAKLAMLVGDRFERARVARSAWTRDAAANYEFFEGNQWILWDMGRDVFRTEKAPDWQRRVMVNGLFNMARVVVSREISQEPVPSASPMTNEEEDRSAARGAVHFLKYVWRKNDGQPEMVRFCTDKFVVGGAYVKAWWDPDGGDEIDDKDSVASRWGVPYDGKSGEARFAHVSWFECFPDPSARSPKEWRWFIQARPLHVDAVFEDYKVKVEPTSARMVDIFGPTEWNLNADLKDVTVLLEYWQLASPDYPNGLHVVQTVDGVVLQKDDGVGTIGIPFEYCPFYPNNRGFHGLTPFTMARSLQHELNVNVSQVSEARSLSTYGKWLTPKGSGIQRPTTAPGETIEYPITHPKPEFVSMPGPSSQVIGLTGMYRDLLQYVVGVESASMGEGESANQSGRHLAFSAEEDRTKQKPSTVFFKSMLKSLAFKLLQLFKVHAGAEVKYAVIGSNSEIEVQALDVGSLTLRDLEFEVESNLPDNRQARREFVLALRDAGVITDTAEVRRLLELPSDSMFGSDNLDKERAREENVMLDSGPVPVWPHENHALHLEEHLPYMKQRRWYNDLPDEMKAYHLQHVNDHSRMLNPPAPPPPMSGGGGPAPQPGASAVPGFKPEGDEAVQASLSEVEKQGTSVIRGE